MESLPWLTMISVVVLSFQFCLVFAFSVGE
jgi:hypothetical protein